MKDSDLRELQRIQSTIPKDLLKRLIVKRKITPTMERVLHLALKEKGISKERREKLETIRESGILSQKEDEVNRSVEKKINRYVSDEIEKSIRAGRLSEKPKKNEQA